MNFEMNELFDFIITSGWPTKLRGPSYRLHGVPPSWPTCREPVLRQPVVREYQALLAVQQQDTQFFCDFITTLLFEKQVK